MRRAHFTEVASRRGLVRGTPPKKYFNFSLRLGQSPVKNDHVVHNAPRENPLTAMYHPFSRRAQQRVQLRGSQSHYLSHIVKRPLISQRHPCSRNTPLCPWCTPARLSREQQISPHPDTRPLRSSFFRLQYNKSTYTHDNYVFSLNYLRT